MASTDPHQDEKMEHAAADMVETVSPTLECVDEGAWASAKKNPKVILYSVAACVSSMLWGFDIGGNISYYRIYETKIDSSLSIFRRQLHQCGLAGIQDGLWIRI